MKIKIFFGNIAIALLSAFIAIIIYTNYFQNEFENKPDIEQKKLNPLSFLRDSNQVSTQILPTTMNGRFFDFTNAAEKSIHAVVHVTSKYNLENEDYYRNPLYEWLYGGGNSKQPSVSFGSGVIISEDGYIVTNYHVIEKSDEIQIVLNDKRTFTAKLIGTDPGTDLALLKVQSSNLPYISFGNSDIIKVGEWALAVGNPFNLTSTVTAGIISAKARDINVLRDQQYSIESYIQTDAAVNQGNSGGALVNLKGELIGINSAIVSPSGSYSGYSFAIPSNIVKKVVDDIIKYGKVQRAVLGVTINDVTGKLAKENNLDKIEGVYIESIRDNGAAKEAGIKKGDVVLEINKVQVNSKTELTEQVGKYGPGEVINLTIKRDNIKKQFKVILRNMHGNTKILKTDKFLSKLGASFRKLESNEKERLGIDGGLKVFDLKEGALKKEGIKEGFIITNIQGEIITDIDDLKKILRREGIGAEIEVNGIYPGLRYIYVYKIKIE